VREKAVDLAARGGGQSGQDPGQVIDWVDLQELACPCDRVDHRRAPAGVWMPDVHPILCAKFCRADAALDAVLM